MNKQIYWSLITIAILLFLGFYIETKHDDNSCEECIIHFKSKPGSQKFGNIPESNISIKAIDIYNNFTEGKCVIIWDKFQGYMKDG